MAEVEFLEWDPKAVKLGAWGPGFGKPKFLGKGKLGIKAFFWAQFPPTREIPGRPLHGGNFSTLEKPLNFFGTEGEENYTKGLASSATLLGNHSLRKIRENPGIPRGLWAPPWGKWLPRGGEISPLSHQKKGLFSKKRGLVKPPGGAKISAGLPSRRAAGPKEIFF